MEKLKTLIKKNKILYTVLSKVYNGTVRPIRNGFFKFYVKYLFGIKKREVSELKKLGFTNISEYKRNQWRIGKGRDNAYRRYYKCNYKGKKAFVKTAQNDSTIKNEIRIGNYLGTDKIDFTPAMILARENLYANTDVIAMEYVENLNEFSCPESYEEFDSYCRQMEKILCSFKEIGIIHADIHKGNLMLTADKKIVVLDFGISMAEKVTSDVNYIARPGTFFVQEGKKRRYDDAYSFVKMVELWSIDEQWKNNNAYMNIVSAIGENYKEIYL